MSRVFKIVVEIDRQNDNPNLCGSCPFFNEGWVEWHDRFEVCQAPAWYGEDVKGGRLKACIEFEAEQAGEKP